MGRNSGVLIFWTHIGHETNSTASWYCQQHAKWDQVTNALPQTAIGTLSTELQIEHGNAEQ